MTGARLRYRLLLRLARAAVLWEQLWPALWPAGAVGAVFVTAALFDLFTYLPPLIHAGILALMAGGFVIAVYLGLRDLRLPGHASGRNRIERDSELAHHPLTALEDNLGSGQGDVAAEALWRAHQEQAAREAARLRVGAPEAGLSRIDPWGLRAVVLLLLVIALVFARGNAVERLARAAFPDFSGGAGLPTVVEVWLTPPGYTHLPPLFLEPGTPPPEALSVPAGTTLLAQASGPIGLPSLSLGETKVPFQALGEGTETRSYRLETTLQAGENLTISTERKVLAEWPLLVVPDAPPQVSLPTPPEPTDRGHLRLAIEATDDYGVAEINIAITRQDDASNSPETIAYGVAMPSRAPTKFQTKSARDLTAHLWAGLPVRLHVSAEDVAGQTARTDAVDFFLPERAFLHPTARAIIAERKKLIDPSDSVRAEVAAGLHLIAFAAGRYNEDVVVMLGLTMSAARLRHDTSEKAVPAVTELLWELALRLEDGGLSIAERNLRRAEERLMEALREGMDNPEVERLLNELESSLRQFLAEMAQELSQMGMMETPIDPNAEFLDTNDLQRMIDEIRDLARSGNLEAARQRLAELQKMLQDLRSAMRPGGNQQQNSQQAQKAQQLMRALQELAKRQQDLLDQTFRRLREQQERNQRQRGQRGQGEPNQQGQPQPGDGQDSMMTDAQIQEALRRALGEMMLDFDSMLGQIPEALGQAERAMRRATEALRGQDGEAAVEAETEALEHLRNGGQQAVQQMARQLGMMPGFVRGDRPVMPMGQNQNRDPFGRRSEEGNSGFAGDNSVEIPSEMDIRRAQEILRELRRRSGQRERPRIELDFIERLLRRF